MRYVFVLLLVTLSAFSLAQKSLSLDQIEQLEQLKNAVDGIQQLTLDMESMIRRREIDCAKAIGYAPFCNCIMEKLPVAWSFADYVAITTRTKDEIGYEKMDAEFRAAYDKVAPIRDKCVTLINKKP